MITCNTFTVRTDNNSLAYVLSSAKLDAMSHRWLASLSAYNFNLQYRVGQTNVLSRRPSDLAEVVYPEAVEAISAFVLVGAEETPAFECVSLSQQVGSDLDEVSGKLSDID